VSISSLQLGQLSVRAIVLGLNDFGPLALYVTLCRAQDTSMVRTTRKIKIKKEKITYCILIPFWIIPHLSLLTSSEILLAVHVQGVDLVTKAYCSCIRTNRTGDKYFSMIGNNLIWLSVRPSFSFTSTKKEYSEEFFDTNISGSPPLRLF